MKKTTGLLLCCLGISGISAQPCILNCPEDIFITLPPGDCSTTINYITGPGGNCELDSVYQTSGLPPGAEFPIGTTTNCFEATDMEGNLSSCCFSITIHGFPNPNTTLACNDNVQISLGENGCIEIGADQILEGGPYGCYDDYLVEIVNSIGLPAGNVACCDHIGDTLNVRVTDLQTGNTCWGTVWILDEWSPEINCTEFTIPCSADYNNVPYPIATDNCDPSPIVELTGLAVLDNSLCSQNQAIVLRTFIATDQYGNESTPCTQTITINRPSFVDFPDDTQWDCDSFNQNPDITAPTASGSGIPAGLDGEFCMYSYSSADQIATSCGATFKIIRTWTVLDWCTGQVITGNPDGEDNIQLIEIVDTSPPSIFLEPFGIAANHSSNPHLPCTSTGYLPPALVSDNCNAWTIRIFTPAGEAIYVNGTDGTLGGIIPDPGLEFGPHTIQYQATDECGNTSDFFVQVAIIDDLAPTAICDEITQVNLNNDGIAAVNAFTFDDGSYDNCCLDQFEVRRMDGDCYGEYDDFGPTAEFCCSDAGNEVTVLLQVSDCHGNFNECMVTVNVSYSVYNDNQPPVTLSCPDGQYITCETYLNLYAGDLATGNYSVLDVFGEPSFFDNCAYYVNHFITQDLNNCSEGAITRSWIASDGTSAAVCNQIIAVSHVSDWVVTFPEDITAECQSGQLPPTGEPQIFFADCELVAVSYFDIVYTLVADACYKIIRTWNVINWCLYDDFGENIHTETGFSECDLNQDWNGDGILNCRTFRDGWNLSGTPGEPDGYISFRQTIKVLDEHPPIFTIPAIDGYIYDGSCSKNLILPYPTILEECSSEIEVDINGDLGFANNISGDVEIQDLGIGEYEVTYTVMDRCGNMAYQTITILVTDAIYPNPICKYGLIAEINPPGAVEITAQMLDEGSFDNCGTVLLSFSPDINDTSRIFTCDNLGFNSVQLWVTDGSGNQNYCETTIEIQDNQAFCTNLAIAGVVGTEQGGRVEGVNLHVNGGLFSQFSDTNGEFLFLTLAQGNDYSVSPHHNANPSNGVTTFDLVLIMRHILGIQTLDSPFKIIAADANRSGSVTTLDMVGIRKVVLQIEPNFPNNTSWRFVDKDYSFPNPQNPWSVAFPEVINYNNLTTSDLEADFVAIKVGDVNGSAATTLDGQTDQRTMMGDLLFHTKDMELKEGQVYNVPFYGNDQAVFGYQFTLEMGEGIELLDVAEGLAKAENFGFALLEEGVLTTSWNEADARVLGSGEAIFTLVIKARENTTLSKELSTSSRYTAAEAYSVNGDLLNVQLTFGNEVAAGFELYQNIPNPFTGVTRIGFRLPEPAAATLTVMDASGKVIRVIKGEYEKGYNELNLSDFGGVSGVLYYRLDTPAHLATRMMVVVE